MLTQPTTPLKTDFAKALRYFPMSEAGLIVTEFYYQYPSSSPFGQFVTEFQFRNMTNQYIAAIGFDKDNDIWQHKIQGESFTNISGSDFIHEAAGWYKFRLVLDFLNFKYKSFEINSLKFDLSDISLHSQASAGSYYANMHLQIFSPANGSQGRIYIDDFLITEIN